MRIVPPRIETDAGQFTVRRAWPGRNGKLTIEATDDAGRLRAGTIGTTSPVIEPYGHDPSLTDLPELLQASTGQAPRLLVHRHRRRAVLHSHGADGERYIKVLPAGAAEHVASVSEQMRRHGAGTGVVVPVVLASSDAGGGRVDFAPLAGSSFYTIGGRGDAGRWTLAWTLWAQLWPQFVASGDDGGLGIYSAEDEVRTVNRWVERLLSFTSEVPGGEVHELAAYVSGMLSDGPTGRTGLSHRDLHDKQLFFANGASTIGLLDCDTAAVAELALDVANLSVHVDLRRDQRSISAEAHTAARRSIALVKQQLNLEPERIAAYELSTRLRLACLYAFRPGWEDLAHRWLLQLVRRLDEKTLIRL